MFRKSSVIRAGNYDPFLYGCEDYDLWYRMIRAGCRMKNLPGIMLYSRIGTALYKRRQDPQNTSSYMHIKKVMLRDGFITRWQFCVSVAGILFLKFAPCGLIRTVYKKILREKQGDFS